MSLASEAHARRTDPWTSHAAARSIPEEKLRVSQQAVLTLLRQFRDGATDEKLVTMYQERIHLELPYQSPSGLRTRRKELVDAGYVEDTGRRERLLSGRQAIVWAVREAQTPGGGLRQSVSPEPPPAVAEAGPVQPSLGPQTEEPAQPTLWEAA